ncbi:helix-turn-helix domain-containing protein [Paraglaciecola arctica]|uniref:AraC family transcriptional regulator, transcriptional activator FtrA n=1 Tax=Paraglaciecola arctica BSs20135 TaxID=493475 RepID=K6YT20_9ALTE|nr:helix-turn-helix domain-containing protein [Paraglaciecola arctica]GAC19838.1 AraC family transcriptional regulator, transcriptional activator FtrA [Paraglaciecola arctica BSs20135]
MSKVAILAFDQVATFELACAIEIFAISRPEYENWYQTEVVCFEKSLLQATGGIAISAKTIQTLDSYQTLVIPSWNTRSNHVRLDLAEKVNGFCEQGGRIISFCSGAFLLAQLGLLQNKQATTHWRYSEIFKQRFPLVNFVDDVLYTHDQNISCSAGSAAALDLGIDIVRQDFGHEIANQVARRLVISPHRHGGQAQYIETPVAKNTGAFSQTLDWAIKHLNQPLSVDELAQQANMSRRSFDRHFKSALGVSPKAWINQQRINLAKQLLEVEDLSIEQLANKVGYDNGITLRFNFNKYVGVAPSQYQSQFKVN